MSHHYIYIASVMPEPSLAQLLLCKQEIIMRYIHAFFLLVGFKFRLNDSAHIWRQQLDLRQRQLFTAATQQLEVDLLVCLFVSLLEPAPAHTHTPLSYSSTWVVFNICKQMFGDCLKAGRTF